MYGLVCVSQCWIFFQKLLLRGHLIYETACSSRVTFTRKLLSYFMIIYCDRFEGKRLSARDCCTRNYDYFHSSRSIHKYFKFLKQQCAVLTPSYSRDTLLHFLNDSASGKFALRKESEARRVFTRNKRAILILWTLDIALFSGTEVAFKYERCPSYRFGQVVLFEGE